MSDNCQLAREALYGLCGDLELRPGAALQDEELARHLERCANCSALRSRLEAQSRILADCEKLVAPRELEGRVVAALQPGYRQDRVARAVTTLAPASAPEALTTLLEQDSSARPALRHALGSGTPAPNVLERLVAEEISDPAQTRARRSMEYLRREKAPSALDARIARLLSPFGRLRRVARPVGLAAAAALVVLLVVPVLRPDLPSGMQPETPSYSFRVVRGGSLRDLDPQARQLLDGLTGGALFLNGEAR